MKFGDVREFFRRNSTPQRLPWLMGSAGVLFYFITLNSWLNFNNLGTVARLSGWQWQSEFGRPLSLLVYGPFLVFPSSWLPLMLNLVTAVIAALVLVQLTRSVAILRYDLPSKDPLRRRNGSAAILDGPWAWLPPVFATLALGLQWVFWQHATSASGEMLSLLCFASAFRCLLEFRLEPQQKWLSRCALIYAVGMTDNWLMIGYLPLLIAALIWVKGYGSFLRFRFLLRMALFGMLGLSLYLVVPALLVWGQGLELDFWHAARLQLSTQKHALLALQEAPFRLLVITGILPFFLLAVRWRSHTVQLADDTHHGVFVTRITGHIIHALFFITAIWVAFNPNLISRTSPIRLAFLVYYYLWATVAGYCAGYLLLFGQVRRGPRGLRWPGFIAATLLVLLTGVLLWKNATEIRLTNGRALHEFARQLQVDLPPGPVVVLSDEALPLFLAQAESAAFSRDDDQRLFIQLRALPQPRYHRYMQRRHPECWPQFGTNDTSQLLGPLAQVRCVMQLMSNAPAVYLQPSSGLFFERFKVQPNGWSQWLTLAEHRTDPVCELPEARLVEIDRRWQQCWERELAGRAAQFDRARQVSSFWSQPFLKSLNLARPVNDTAVYLAEVYSKALNYWGVQMQRGGRSEAAATWFERALELNPNNLSARLNQEYARRRAAGAPERLSFDWVRETMPGLVARFQNWAEVISGNGPVDEPTLLLQSGRMYLVASSPRQARDCFARCAELQTNWPLPRLWLAQTEAVLGNFAAAARLTEPLLTEKWEGPALVQLLYARALGLYGTGRTNEATAFIESFTEAHQDSTQVLAIAAAIYADTHQYQSELKWRDELLRRDPDQKEAIILKAQAQMNLQDFAAARESFESILARSPDDSQARLGRAVLLLQAGRLEESRREYETLLEKEDSRPSAHFGLGGIAFRQKDTNAMIFHYQTFLSNSPPYTPQAGLALRRLKAWTTN